MIFVLKRHASHPADEVDAQGPIGESRDGIEMYSGINPHHGTTFDPPGYEEAAKMAQIPGKYLFWTLKQLK